MTESESKLQEAPILPSHYWLWAPWVLGSVLLAVGLSLWEPFPPGIWHDDGVYVLLGRALAQGEGLRYVGVPGAPLASKFPPLFPLLLSLIWRIFPSFPDNVSYLGGLNLLLTALSASVFCLYLRKIHRIPAHLSLALTAFIWVSAHLWRVAAIPLSEPVFLLALVLALWAGGRMEARRGAGPVFLFLIASGFAVYARTLGVAILLAGFLSLILEGRKSAALGVALGTLALLAPWVLWSQKATASLPAPLLDTLGPYGPWLAGQILQEPLVFARFMFGNMGHLLGRILTLVTPGPHRTPIFFSVAVVPVLVTGMWLLFQRSKVLPLTLLFSLGILATWPFQDVRLLVPFLPLLISGLVLGFWRLGRSDKLPKRVRTGVLAVACAWGLLFASVSLYRLGSGWHTQPYRIRSEVLVDVIRAVTENTPPDAVVGAPELWSGIHLFTGRAAVPSARFRPLAGDGLVEGTVEEQYAIWIVSGMTHVLAEHGGRVHGPALDRLEALCPPGTLTLLDNQPGRYLLAVNWDEACQDRVLHNETDGL